MTSFAGNSLLPSMTSSAGKSQDSFFNQSRIIILTRIPMISFKFEENFNTMNNSIENSCRKFNNFPLLIEK
jgi:hypothetical protein